MKKISACVIAGFVVVNLFAQNPVHKKDTLNHKQPSDSVDFKNKIYEESSSQNDINRRKQDTLPLDDRKYKDPPKK